MLFFLHYLTKPFVFEISNIISNYKYSMNTQVELVVLSFHHLIVIDIYVLDLVTEQFVNGMLKHQIITLFCVDILPLQSNDNGKNDNNKNNSIGCLMIMDIEFVLDHLIITFESGILEQLNNLLYQRTWKFNFKSGQQIQVFNGHTSTLFAVECSPFVKKDDEVGGNSNVICYGSYDNTIRVWG
ncbi:hypothetical protein RFI_01952 [Reticulomyxa filosa]|uniref:Uncharacterized protein n=1 Tax=Reticulomyxa filosa TaxID=46433 RepID=X6PAC8_RETFI|nr:hypothetical protein RFI_01952 [Reticulomyxa filosa]|eukprot:ETO35121.1 hypothetical protein RFI_01952 [Reticulomyxa filosa]